MSDAGDEALAFLRPLIVRPPYSHRPWVTLTYAQSLDGKLAGAEGTQIQLSGKESKAMTHRSVSCPRLQEDLTWS
jgi:hypothetical protein